MKSPHEDILLRSTPSPGGRRTIPHHLFARAQWAYVLLCNLAPAVGMVLAFALLPWWQPSAATLVVMAVLWVLSLGLGISVGYHRLFSHRAFACSRVLRVFIGICGSIAGQGPIIAWVANHRCHHQHSDIDGDPHSPWLMGESFFGRLRGLWHSHFGWILTFDIPDPLFYCPDLLRDRAISRTSRLFFVWYLAGLLLPGIVLGLVEQSGMAALMGFLWAGCVRVAVTSHITWSINSLCHYFGHHPHSTGDRSRNLPWLSIASFGESWHNNHHAFPRSAAFGHSWKQVDLGYLLVLLLARLGLAWDVQLPKETGDQ